MIRAGERLAFVSFVLLCAWIIGCAAPGDPSPRHRVVPAAIIDLAAGQSGNAVVLTFSLPRQSIDREPLSETPTIEIYRAALSPGASAGGKTAWRQVYTIPSERVDSYVSGDRIEFRDLLTADELGSSAGPELAYMVRTRAVKSVASGDSNIFTTHIYPPPGNPRDLRASVNESAIALSWSDPTVTGAAPKTVGYRVYRAEIEAGEESPQQDLSKLKLKSPLTLQASSVPAEFNDTHFEFGHSYVYVVRTVAEYGSNAIESADSAPVVITPRDTFPPATPVALEATIISATPNAPAHVELSWAISAEGDLAGYHVYRSDAEGTPGERVDREPLPSPTFRDISVVPGRLYFYRVSAVDHAGNESPLSSTVQVEVP